MDLRMEMAYSSHAASGRATGRCGANKSRCEVDECRCGAVWEQVQSRMGAGAQKGVGICQACTEQAQSRCRAGTEQALSKRKLGWEQVHR
jgi:hypothetical protein